MTNKKTTSVDLKGLKTQAHKEKLETRARAMESELDDWDWKQETEDNGWMQNCLKYILDKHVDDLVQLQDSEGHGHSLWLQHFLSHMGKCEVKLSNNVTTLICPDCDGCSEECDHKDHGIMLRQDSISDHMARTGHRRCRVAREIKPEIDCRVGGWSH